MGLENKGGLISILIGLPLGLITGILLMIVPAAITGEGLATMALVGMYGYSIVGMFIVFPVMLWIAGVIMVNDILVMKAKWKIAWRYSFNVNSVIWFAFLVIYFSNYNREGLYIGIIPIVIAALISFVGTPFTISLIVYSLIKNRVNIGR